MKNPKVFISYSWSSPTHQQWVIDLGENLIASGIEVVLDKWDLKPGQDSIAFMESMVTDTTIDKVLIICDRTYAERADGRNGGVGTETQIISKKVYEQVNQERFIAVIAEKDEDQKAFTPTFYHSRIYIDLSTPESYSDGFEELIRTIYNQPQHVKPPLGKKPDFLTNEIHTTLGTAPLAKRATSLIRDNKPNATAALEEYLQTFAENLERARIDFNKSAEYDEQILNNINNFTSSRNELLQVLTNAIRYLPEQDNTEHIHKFLESILKYQDLPEGINSWNEHDFDNFKFIIHEIFLYTITICLKFNKYEIATNLLNKSYYIRSRRGDDYLSGFECFYKDAGSLELRNRRLKLGRTSLSADVTKNNNTTSGIDFSLLMQTDFLLFVRCEMRNEFWWPKTLVYLGHYPGAFEIFTRSASQAYFEKLKRILNVNSKKELEEFVESASTRSARSYGFDRWSLDFKRLMNISELDTRS
jgi:hypothetical protein